MILNKRNAKGFTLIELMIVVAIIGILAAVAVPKFADLVTKSKEASVKGSIGAVRSALSIYYGDTEGSYPTNLFTGLTTANKYMPASGGSPSLGRFEIPANNNGNPGHKTGYYNNATAEAAVYYDTDGTNGVTPQDPGTQALIYMATAPAFGEVYINCSHRDTKNVDWTTY
jgi:prepilin-type N-terminal cleavage/methylation domain-containing protein